MPWVLAAGLLFESSAGADDRTASTVRRAVEARQLLSLAEILDRVLPRMAGATYIGAEFEPSGPRYRLKFISGRLVIWVDVDARSGRIIGRFSP
jgi:uncharacterized membrane protein YkoI